jgi:hypothetical protein
MPTKFFTVAAYGTLVIDVYLALAAVATKVDVRHLPPFGAERVTDGLRFLVLIVATWTATLAIGCLRAGRGPATTQPASVFWFVLVLGLVWIGLLLPWLLQILFRGL